MNTLLYYLLQVVIASGILYLYYHISLRNKKFHQYNRFYLLGALIISMLVPFFNIPVYFSQQEAESSMVLQTLTVISLPVVEDATVIPDTGPVEVAATTFTLTNMLYCLYALLAVLALVKITWSLLRIRWIRKSNPVQKIDTISFINTSEPGTPFSFFNWMFWNKNIELNSDKGQQIFRHELFHIQQKHSIDLLFIELITVIFWINPFYHLMKKELRAIHEFLADQFAITKTDKWKYAELLLMQALCTKHSLVNPFFHNQVTRRIAMITNPQKTSFRYLRKLLVLPVGALIAILFAFQYKTIDQRGKTSSPEQITVVIDAGHGGIDPGAQSIDNKFSEARLSLQLAKRIQALAPEFNINVIMTRENDALPGGATNTSQGNRNRVAIADKVKPAAFIALHVNSAGKAGVETNHSGFEAYVSSERNDEGGKKIASAILQELSAIYKTAGELKTRKNANIHVLDKNTSPAVVLQCGFINNPKDLAFITDEANQEKIARAILTALSSYDNYSTFTGKAPVETNAYSNIHDRQKFNFSPNPPGDMLIIVDGEKINNKILAGKTLIASGVFKLYEENDPEAIRLYGKEAVHGVLVVSDAEFIESVHSAYTDVDVPPSFPGGKTAWASYLSKNLNTAVPSKNNAPPGKYTVRIYFVVDKDGNVKDVEPLGKKQGYGMEEEAMRVMKTCPNWIPAIKDGKAVHSYYSQYITFIVSAKNDRWLSESMRVSDNVKDASRLTLQLYSGITQLFPSMRDDEAEKTLTAIADHPDPGANLSDKEIVSALLGINKRQTDELIREDESRLQKMTGHNSN